MRKHQNLIEPYWTVYGVRGAYWTVYGVIGAIQVQKLAPIQGIKASWDPFPYLTVLGEMDKKTPPMSPMSYKKEIDKFKLFNKIREDLKMIETKGGRNQRGQNIIVICSVLFIKSTRHYNLWKKKEFQKKRISKEKKIEIIYSGVL